MVYVLGFHPIDGTPLVLVGRQQPTERKSMPPGAAALGAGGADGTRAARSIVANFARVNVVDKDNDVTLPGAFPTKDVLLSQFGHGSWDPGRLPVGRGRIREENGWAVFRGTFFDTPVGRESFDTIKAAGELIEWSYGYNVLDAEFGTFQGRAVRFLKKLDVIEVSPVMVGAGVGTGTLETSGASALSLQIAAAARQNELALGGLDGHKSRVVGWAPDGGPIRVAHTARQPARATKADAA